MTHREVVENYASRRANRKTRDISWRGTNVSCTGRALLSYHWWPLAYHLGTDLFLKQGDRYSVSTSSHQAMVQAYCDGPTVSFSALEAAGIQPESIAAADLVDWTPDTSIHLKRGTPTDPWIRMDTNEHFVQPPQGLLVRIGQSEQMAYWHLLGACLLNRPDGQYLCSIDENAYFVAQLGFPARSVEEVFVLLKPREVRRAEAEGTTVKRQGEWFFVDTGMEDRDLANQQGWTVRRLRETESYLSRLPRSDAGGNPHDCRQLMLPSGQILASGCVRHPDHSMLRLGNTWWRVYRNTEIRSWSQGGRFD